MNYASVIWYLCSSKDNLNKVLRLQKRAARLILDASPQAPSVELFNKLKWIPFYEEAKIKQSVLAFKRLRNSVPKYLIDNLKLNSDLHKRSTRYSIFNFRCPIFNRKTEGGKTFTVTTTQLWNTIDINIRKLPTVRSFRNVLKMNIFKTQQNLAHFNP